MERQKTALIVGMAKSGIAAARLLYQDNYCISTASICSSRVRSFR